MYTARSTPRSFLTRLTLGLTLTLVSLAGMAAPTWAQLPPGFPGSGIQNPVLGPPINLPPPLNLPKPTITSCNPNSAQIGAVVHVNGSNFNRGFDGLIFSGATPWKPSIRDSQGIFKDLPFTVLSTTQLRVTIPSGAKSGVLCLRQGNAVRASLVQLTIVVPPPPPPVPGVIRFRNDAQYDLSSFKLDGVDLIPFGQVYPAGGFQDITGISPGNHVIVVTYVRFWFGAAVPPFGSEPITRTITLNMPSGGLVPVTIPPFLARDLLSRLSPTGARWSGQSSDQNGIPVEVTLDFTTGGNWTQRVNGVVHASGTVIHVKWDRYAGEVQFKLEANGPVISTFDLFTHFSAYTIAYTLVD